MLRPVTLLAVLALPLGAQEARDPKATVSPASTMPTAITLAPPTPPVVTEPEFDPRPVENWIEAQVELHRRGFSCGSIDGVRGAQSAAALAAFQQFAGLKPTGDLDQPTREALLLTSPALETHVLTIFDLGRVAPLPDTWVGKSQVESLKYGSVLELMAEVFRASPRFLQRLNPNLNWDDLLPGAPIVVPAVGAIALEGRAARIHVRLAERILQVHDTEGRTIAHFPVSIAKHVDKRPVGELHVTVTVMDPNYTFDPANFPENEEARTLTSKLIIPPGPNNPVGVVWIGLDRPGYGIHGTPDPEKVGRTESHGCFRLANWDALILHDLAWVGLPVVVEP
jgi:lipoprotein-anchoring transpeptidase ErfK/SrfK